MLRTVAILSALAILISSGVPVTAVYAQTKAPAAPAFTFDTEWMKLPTRWVLGDVSSVAVDRNDNVWVLHRPRSVAAEQRERAAPPVLEFDRNGNFLRGWGGPGDGFDWPSNEHSIFVDRQNLVWISGSARTRGASDDMILAFNIDGKFVRQIGERGGSRGNLDTENLSAPADLFVDVGRNEIYAADGYGNRRIIVFDTRSGSFKRMWGAFGEPPQDNSPARTPTASLAPAAEKTGEGARQFGSVHGVEVARDGLVYVSDRDSQRVQVFDRMGRYKAQVFIHRNGPSPLTASGLALSADRGQRFLYVIDYAAAQIVVLDRKSLVTVAEIGGPGKEAGQFSGPHLMAMDSRGVLYVAEVPGRRVQRLIPKRP